jgi:hypothetical protein
MNTKIVYNKIRDLTDSLTIAARSLQMIKINLIDGGSGWKSMLEDNPYLIAITISLDMNFYIEEA